MIPKPIARRLRPLWLAAAGSAVWANRADATRWLRFAKRTISERGTRPLADILAESRVRAAVSSDPVLRRDPSLRDLRVQDGLVTLQTNGPAWPDPQHQIARLKKIKGITGVTASHGG